MSFNFLNLDEKTRIYMIEETEKAKNEDNLYYSKRFNISRDERWPSLLLEAAKQHDETGLLIRLKFMV